MKQSITLAMVIIAMGVHAVEKQSNQYGVQGELPQDWHEIKHCIVANIIQHERNQGNTMVADVLGKAVTEATYGPAHDCQSLLHSYADHPDVQQLKQNLQHRTAVCKFSLRAILNEARRSSEKGATSDLIDKRSYELLRFCTNTD